MTQTQEPTTRRRTDALEPSRAADPQAAETTLGTASAIPSREAWRLLLRETMVNRSAVVMGVSAGLAWTGFRVLIPLMTGIAIEHGIRHHSAHSLAFWTMLVTAVGALSAICSGLRRYFAFRVAYAVETQMREGMFANLQRLDFHFHDQSQTGGLMARAATDLQQINSLIVMIPMTLANALLVPVTAVILFVIDPTLALVAMATLPFINVAAKRFSTSIHPVSMELQQQLAGLSTVVEETVTGIRAVKGFGAEGIQLRHLTRQAGRIYDRIIELARLRGLFTPMLDVLPVFSLAGILWYGGYQILHHQLSIGNLTAFNIYVVLLIGPLQMLGQIVAQAQRAVASTQRVKEILDAAPIIKDTPHSSHLPKGEGHVRFESVRFSYGQGGRAVLDGFDLEIAPGESVALVGATGSGKSTVARLLPRFYDPDAGRILLDGQDIREVRLRELRRAVAIVFEDTFLFSDTVAANIAFADPQASMKQIVAAAELAGAHDFLTQMEEGYDTMLGERGFSLSGGQRQRIALARAILANPRVLVLDDATSSVDATKEHEIRAALQTVMEGRTTIVIAHRPATIALAQRVVLLDEGRIVAQGTHESLSADNRRYQEVLAQGALQDAARAAEEVQD